MVIICIKCMLFNIMGFEIIWNTDLMKTIKIKQPNRIYDIIYSLIFSHTSK